MTEENELVGQTALGDTKAFNRLYELFAVNVFNTAISYLRNQEEAEEITQDVFVEVHFSAVTFKGDSSVNTWIYRITVNKCLDRIRHRKRKKRFAFIVNLFYPESQEVKQDTPHFDHPGIILENKENASFLFAAIETLPHQQKTAFILAYIEDLPQKEIASIMNLSVKAIESLLQRAKVNLRRELETIYEGRRK